MAFLGAPQRPCVPLSPARPGMRRLAPLQAAKGPGKRSGGAKKGGAPPGQPAQPARAPPQQQEPAGAAAVDGSAAATVTPPAAQAPASARRDDVVSAALSTSLGLTVAGAGLRNFASSAASRGWPVPDLAAGVPLPSVVLDGAALRLPTPDLAHVGLALAVAAGVTAARAAALALWPDFREESERANAQVLPSLSTLDVLLISIATGASEELLFRCTLLPGVAADWRGVVVSAAVFGALHISGGRRTSFAIWAAGVGLAYGALAVVLRDGAAPMIAHAAANAAGGMLWRAANPEAVGAGNAATAALAQAAALRDAAQTAADAGADKTTEAAAERPPWGRPDED